MPLLNSAGQDVLVKSPEVTLTEADVAFIQKYMDVNLRLNRNMVVPGSFPPGSIPTAALADGSVATAKLADDAVTGPKLLIPTGRFTGTVKAVPGGIVTLFNTLTSVGHNQGLTFTASSNTPVTIITAGVYDVTIQWAWVANAAGERITYINYNGAGNVPIDSRPPTAAGNAYGTLTMPSISLAAGATIGIAFFQNANASPATLNVQVELSVSFRSSV
jgi:hypothetical protein